MIKGLVVNRFATGITIQGDSVANRIEGNYVGTDSSGTLARGSNTISGGVKLLNGPSGNVVGGTTPAARNVISGNDSDGITFDNTGSANRIQGNYIGTDKSGTKDLGNTSDGIFIINTSGSTIGARPPPPATWSRATASLALT